jgi:hypothetical protein
VGQAATLRHRLELSMLSPELVSRFQGITYGLWAKGCYTDTRRDKEFYTETIYTLFCVRVESDIRYGYIYTNH